MINQLLGRVLVFLMFVGFGCGSLASSTAYNISAGLKTFPFGFSVGAEAKLSQFLWDKREANTKSILFGLVTESLVLGSHGLLGVNIDFYPISFVKISVGQSVVSKYYKIATLDCSKVECKGTLAKNYYKVALALVYSNFVLLPQHSNVNMVSQSHWQPFGSEDEYLVGAAGNDTAISNQVLLGYKYFDSLVGLFIKSTKMQEYENSALSRYFLWQMPLSKIIDVSANSSWQMFQDESKMKLSVGAGIFSSDWADPGFSLIVGLKCGGGDDPALF